MGWGRGGEGGVGGSVKVGGAQLGFMGRGGVML